MNLIILKLKINRNIDKHNLLLAIYIINYIIQEMKLKIKIKKKNKNKNKKKGMRQTNHQMKGEEGGIEE